MLIYHFTLSMISRRRGGIARITLDPGIVKAGRPRRPLGTFGHSTPPLWAAAADTFTLGVRLKHAGRSPGVPHPTAPRTCAARLR